MFCIIQRLWKTSKTVFQSVINTWKESRCSENSSKISQKCQIWVRNFDENFFFIKIFLILYWNVNTFRIIYKTWKAFVVLSQAVNDTSGSAHELQGSLKIHELVTFRSNFDKHFFNTFQSSSKSKNKQTNCQITNNMFCQNIEGHVLALMRHLLLLIRLWNLSTFCGWSKRVYIAIKDQE